MRAPAPAAALRLSRVARRAASPLLLLLTTAGALGSGCGEAHGERGSGADGQARERASGIVHGQITHGSPAVVAIVKRRSRCHEPFVEAFCSGVLVAPRVVLTAAHCTTAGPPLDLEVFVGDEANGGGGSFFAAVDQRVHPGYDEGTFDNDLAMIELERAPGVEPVSLADVEAPAKGSLVRVVGFGGEGSGSDGIKREGTSIVTSVEPLLLRTEPSPSLACGGDSGAPVLVDGPSGPRLVGIVRSGDGACATFTNATRLDAYLTAFVAPYASAPPGPSRRGASLLENACASPCQADDDCPRGMLCLPERSLGSLCGYADLRSGSLGEACSVDAQCPSGICAASGPGDEGRSCGCFTSCRDQAALALRRPAAPRLEPAGGCSSASPPRQSPALTATALGLAIAARRRRQGRAGSRRAS